MQEDAADDRFRRIAVAVAHLLQNGDEIVLRGTEEGPVVEELPTRRFERDHPRLYGRLLALDLQLQGGCSVYLFFIGILGAFVLGLQIGWWDTIIPPRVAESINVWWVHLLLGVGALALAGEIYEILSRRTYRQGRPELIALMEESGLDRDLLVVAIRMEPELRNVLRFLQLDRRPFPRPDGSPPHDY